MHALSIIIEVVTILYVALAYIQPKRIQERSSLSHLKKRAKTMPEVIQPQILTADLRALPLRPCLHALILPTRNILQSPLEVLSRALQARRVVGGIEVGVDELDQPVDVLGGHGVVFLVEVVDVAVQDLDEELDGDGRVHAGICDAERALEAFEDALAVAVWLRVC